MPHCNSCNCSDICTALKNTNRHYCTTPKCSFYTSWKRNGLVHHCTAALNEGKGLHFDSRVTKAATDFTCHRIEEYIQRSRTDVARLINMQNRCGRYRCETLHPTSPAPFGTRRHCWQVHSLCTETRTSLFSFCQPPCPLARSNTVLSFFLSSVFRFLISGVEYFQVRGCVGYVRFAHILRLAVQESPPRQIGSRVFCR